MTKHGHILTGSRRLKLCWPHFVGRISKLSEYAIPANAARDSALSNPLPRAKMYSEHQIQYIVESLNMYPTYYVLTSPLKTVGKHSRWRHLFDVALRPSSAMYRQTISVDETNAQ